MRKAGGQTKDRISGEVYEYQDVQKERKSKKDESAMD
jgi:hypothetical protein